MGLAESLGKDAVSGFLFMPDNHAVGSIVHGTVWDIIFLNISLMKIICVKVPELYCSVSG